MDDLLHDFNLVPARALVPVVPDEDKPWVRLHEHARDHLAMLGHAARKVTFTRSSDVTVFIDEGAIVEVIADFINELIVTERSFKINPHTNYIGFSISVGNGDNFRARHSGYTKILQPRYLVAIPGVRPEQLWETAFRDMLSDEYDEWGFGDANGLIGREVKFDITVIRPPEGGVRVKQLYEGDTRKYLDEFLRRKLSIIRMTNTDFYCMPRAIFTLICRGIYDKTSPKPSQYERPSIRVKLTPECEEVITEKLNPYLDECRKIKVVPKRITDAANAYNACVRGQKTQLVGAKWLCKQSGIKTPVKNLLGTSDLYKIEDFLGIRIRILDVNAANKYVYNGNEGLPKSPALTLLLSDNHFHALTTMAGYFGVSYYCATCDVKYSHLQGHVNCKKCCTHCHQNNCDAHKARANGSPFPNKAAINCDGCGMNFYSKICYEGHKEPRNGSKAQAALPRCNQLHVCGEDGCKPYNPVMYENTPDGESSHVCGDTPCLNCSEILNRNEASHRCCMQVTKLKKPSKKYVFFDFECEQSTDFHKVTHVVAQYLNKDKYFEWQPKPNGDFSTVLDEFCKWIFSFKRHSGFTFIAHNGQGYDFQFILRWALDRNMEVKALQRAGTKIKHMDICGIRFIDSYSFLTVPLSAFPKTFGLKELRKGYFPHLFNRPENQNYKGPFPDRETYIPSNLNSKALATFNKWYDTQAGKTFDFRHEIMAYCRSDVDILRRGCEVFRATFIEEVDLDPFNSITIASACMSLYRSTFMPENTLGLLTPSESKFIRRGFYGGRTNVMRAHCKVKDEDEEIRYADVKSLYPSVNYYGTYPRGTPEWIIGGNTSTINSNYGFFEIDYTPPTSLRHPVLPSRSDNKLLFQLNPMKNQVHSTMELQLAIRKGYVINKVHRGLIWKETTDSMFKPYVSHFMKAKEEASGWVGKLLDGKQVSSLEEKKAWIEDFKTRQGVTLEFDKITVNPGRRAIAKLCLNSLWGKLGQSTNPTQTEFHTIPANVFKLLEDKDVRNIFDISPTTVEVNYKEKADNDEMSKTTCLSVAAMTTAQARLRLYEGLDAVGSNALYCDTDSIIYHWRPNSPEIKIGDMLGEWTDELDAGDCITEFVGCGPKLYAYTTKGGEVAVKAKGFRITESNSHVLSFNNFVASLKEVKQGRKRKRPYNYIVKGTQLVRSKFDKSIKTQPLEKRFEPTVRNKGTVDIKTLDVFPFGYVKPSK
jgi:hypothetical protein